MAGSGRDSVPGVDMDDTDDDPAKFWLLRSEAFDDEQLRQPAWEAGALTWTVPMPLPLPLLLPAISPPSDRRQAEADAESGDLTAVGFRDAAGSLPEGGFAPVFMTSTQKGSLLSPVTRPRRLKLLIALPVGFCRGSGLLAGGGSRPFSGMFGGELKSKRSGRGLLDPRR